MKCPCDETREFEACCGPVLGGQRPAGTALELMRARYSAYATGNIDFIIDSLRKELLQGPLPAQEVDRAVAYVREIITDDPTVDLLLRGK